MLTYIFLVIRIFLIDALNVEHFLDTLHYSILILSVVSIAAAGYIINDIHDLEIDKINKNREVIIENGISEDFAFNLYFALNIIGIASGFYLAYKIEHVNFAFIHIASSLLLYQYAVKIKHKLIISNLLVSFLSGLSLVLIILFDLLPAINEDSIEIIKPVTLIILVYAAFAFVVSFIREIIKDIEDFKGDKEYGTNSIAVRYGIRTAKNISATLSFIAGAAILFYSVRFLADQIISLSYVIALVILPLLYTAYLLIVSKKESDVTLSTKLIKFIMLSGISSIAIFTLSLKFSNVL